MITVIISATTWTKHVAKRCMGRKENSQDKVRFTTPRDPDATFAKWGKRLTRLEDEGASDIHVPTIARWFYTLIGAQ